MKKKKKRRSKGQPTTLPRVARRPTAIQQKILSNIKHGQPMSHPLYNA